LDEVQIRKSQFGLKGRPGNIVIKSDDHTVIYESYIKFVVERIEAKRILLLS